jgi:UDP-glucose 4-epimerase
MKVLITGGEGYIGSYLTELLLNSGFEVTTLDNGFNSRRYNLEGHTKQLKRFYGSVCNADVVSRAMEGVKAVYHLAARMDFENSNRHPIRLQQTNVEGTTNILCCAKKSGVDKVVFTSSASVYGNLVGSKETDPTSPLNMYGATKLAAEAICRGFYQSGQETIILRFFNCWGRSLSNSFVNKLVTQENPVILGDGRQTRDFVYIEDVLSALKNCLAWDSGIYNIGTGEEITIEALWRTLRKEEPQFKFYPVGYNDIFRSCADITFTTSQTGWKPTVLMSELSKDDIAKMCSRL